MDVIDTPPCRQKHLWRGMLALLQGRVCTVSGLCGVRMAALESVVLAALWKTCSQLLLPHLPQLAHGVHGDLRHQEACVRHPAQDVSP